VLSALIHRGREGGSWWVDTSLTYYSLWLIQNVGKYDSETWEDIWGRYDNIVWRYDDDMGLTTPHMLKLMRERAPWLFKSDFFETAQGPMGRVRYVAPVVEIDKRRGKYDVPTRDNVWDKPSWVQNE
jgi:hypothetical protein